TSMAQQVRTKQCLRSFLKKHARIPSVRQMRRRFEPKPKFPGLYNFIVIQSTSGTNRTVIHKNHTADDAAYGLGAGRKPKPVVQGAAFVRLKVAEADVPERCRVDDL